MSHAGNIMTLHETDGDGRIPVQRLRGRKMHPDLLGFGERILIQPFDYKHTGNSQPRRGKEVFALG